VRVLVVEDQPKMQERALPWTAPETGRRRCTEAREGSYDAVVLDVILPGLNGFEVVSRLRAEDVWTPLLMLAARAALAGRVRGLDASATTIWPESASSGAARPARDR
jgi:two-component system OmpR family response regulator